MAGGRAIPIALLLCLLITAHFALAWQSEKNGTFTLPFVFDFKTRTLPNTHVPITLPQTGVTVVDNYFAFMLTFFWMALDTRNVRAHLQAGYLLGTLSGTWIIMLTEVHRGAVSTSFMLLTYFFEMMGEFLGIGLFTPMWCAFHLFLTKAPKFSTRKDAEKGLSAASGSSTALGYALLFGHLAPTLIMRFTKIDGVGLQSQQLWTILRLFHPVYVLAFFTLFKTMQSNLFSSSDTDPAARFAYKRKFYTFAILASAFGHLFTLSILLGQHWVPDWLRPEVLSALDLKTVVFPVPFWYENPVKLVPFVTGVATFLQWDNICSASAIFVWASSLYLEAVSSGATKVNIMNLLSFMLQTTGVTLLAGPVAGAAYVLQERDVIVVNNTKQESNSKK